MLGGYALAGRGAAWVRTVCALVIASSIPVWVLTAEDVGGPALAVTHPRGAWAAALYWSLLATFALAAAIPHRRPETGARARPTIPLRWQPADGCLGPMLSFERSGPTGSTPILLLHAGIADRRMWDSIWPTLTAARDVVRVDLRGFGESTERPDGPWSPRADVLATLDALGVERAHVVGCSLGAGVAVELALERPDAVASLVLAAPGGSLITERTEELAAFWSSRARPSRRVTWTPPPRRTWWPGSTARTVDRTSSPQRP